ncbi:plasmid pRiA4b ORF-3 family protein [Puniceicoccaceae bacterium K14]|nr:plasmid pRiA4b ORF-3 family protein [Puniceicoccaceae bacterium K14]
MNTYTLRIDDGDGYSAEVAISGNINLYGLAEHIIDTIGFDFDHAFGFYDNLKNPYESSEKYTLFADMGEGSEDEASVQRTLIEEVFEPKKQMVFLFDYGDDWQFLLTCVNAQAATTKRKIRRILTEKGEPPIQYPDFEEEEDDI